MEPLQITGIVIVQQSSGDLAVRLERAGGRTAVVTGADYDLEGQPFADVFAVWAFLIWQDPALRVDLVQRALDDYDPSWEEVVAARLRENDAVSARARGELAPREAEDQRRLDLKARWRAQRRLG